MEESKKVVHCRVCLRYNFKNKTKFLSLFETSNGSSLSEKINSIADVNIKQGDGLPPTICPDCVLQLENAILFKEKCEISNKILCNVMGSKEEKTEDINVKSVKKEDILKIEVCPDLNKNCTDYDDNAEYLDESIDDVEDKSIALMKKSKAIDLKLICDDCGGSFKSKCKLRVHWKRAHQAEKLICQTCKRMFKSYKAFNLHKKNKTRNCRTASNFRIEGQGKARIFHCKECNYKSKRIKDIDTHSTTHTGDRRYVCKDCGKCFTQQSSLQCHRESTHKDYKVDTTCHLCGKHLLGRTKYYRHMKIHKEGMVQCKVCNKFLKGKKYLSIHMLRHSGVKSYSCEICAASFFTICELYNHRKKVHLKSRSFACDKCDYKMFSVTAQKKHISKHNGTNVVCLVCGQFSENAEKLVLHQKRHFERNIPCPQCDKMYHNKRSLNKHMCKSHRCSMLVEKREEIKVKYPEIKEESPQKKDEIVILLSPPTILLNSG